MIVRKRLLLESCILLFLVVGVLWRFGTTPGNSFFNAAHKFADVSIPQEILNPLEDHSLFPKPLRQDGDGGAASLSMRGVLTETNKERAKEGLAALKQNAQLDQVAQKKMRDMFDRQYFEHISPSGVGPSDLANQVGYEYIVVGENLALGNFKSDSELVTAWMNSPGHRENILNKKYTELGVAVGKGLFEGRQVWLAVQSFGAPLSNCPGASASLKNQITANQKKLQEMEIELRVMKEALKEQQGEVGYNDKVAEYNEKVTEFNALVEQTKSQVARYNAQVQAFNNCVGN